MESLAFALIAIAAITAGFFVWYFTFKARQEERRFLIEKGYRPEELPVPPTFTFPWRKTGIVMMGAVLGMLLNAVTFNFYNGMVPAMILGAGVGMILSQAFEKGYPVRSFMRTLLFAFTGFTTGGLAVSIALVYWQVDDALVISIVLTSMIVALFIERRTRKA